MSDDFKTFEFAAFSPPQLSFRVDSIASQESEDEDEDSIYWDPSFTPATSHSVASNGRPASFKSSISVATTSTTIHLGEPVQVSFVKGSVLYRLRYTKVDVYRDLLGGLERIEVSNSVSSPSTLVHAFPHSRKPIPHLEQPVTTGQMSLRVSFLEKQKVRIAQSVFDADVQYTFGKRVDCDRFEDAVLGQAVIFAAGVAEIRTKGRGEEATSQNLRVCKTPVGTTSLLYFANSLRRDQNQKGYVSINISTVSSAEMPKKSGKPVSVEFFSEGELPALLKSMTIIFLDDNDARRFCTLLQKLGVHVAKR